MSTGKKEVRVNQRIRVPQVRLIGSEGNQMGVMDTREALLMAESEGLDLVEVSPEAKPPVCRIMDYGKYKYEQAKRDKKAKKRQHVMQLKEIKLRPKIEAHDYSFKMRNARRFLEHRDKVRFTVVFRGRELTHPELGMTLLNEVAGHLADIAAVEFPARLEGRQIVMVLGPRSHKVPKPAQEPQGEVETKEE